MSRRNTPKSIAETLAGKYFRRNNRELNWYTRKAIFMGESRVGKTQFTAGLLRLTDGVLIETDYQGAAFVPKDVPVQYCYLWDYEPTSEEELLEGRVGFLQVAQYCLDNLDPGSLIVIDTADSLFFHNQQDFLEEINEEMMPEDYGKSYKYLADRMRVPLEMLASRFGLAFTVHIQEKEYRTRSGNTYTKIRATIPDSAWSVFRDMADFTFTGLIHDVRTDDGVQRQRYWVADASEGIFDNGPRLKLPVNEIPMDPEKYVEIMTQALEQWNSSGGQALDQSDGRDVRSSGRRRRGRIKRSG